MTRRYGVSNVSLVPYGWLFPYSSERAVSIAKSAGYDGLQVLPLRGWNLADKALAPYVLSYEDAWDYANLFGVVKAKLAKKDTPNFLDWGLFQGAITPLFPDAFLSTHHFYEPGLVGIKTVTEIHPELSLDVGKYVGFAERGGQLCWDTRHVRRPHKDGRANLNWVDLMDKLPSYSIGLIHIQAIDDNELNNFLAGKSTALGSMLRYLAEKAPHAPAIVEVRPTLGSLGSVVSRLSDIFWASRCLLH